MNLKLPMLVAFLVIMLGQQISYAQNGCAPTGTNTSTLQLTKMEIGDAFVYNVENYARYTDMKQTIALDDNNIPVQLNFNNPIGQTFYIGMYVDFDQNGVYSYPGEMIYQAETNAIEHNGTMVLTNDQLATMDVNDLWFRTIVTHNIYFLQNTCSFPSLNKPYQALETRGSKLKIKESTAHDDIFSCLGLTDPMSTEVDFINGYSTDIKITRVTMNYEHREPHYGCNQDYLESISTNIEGYMTANYPEYLYTAFAPGHTVLSGKNASFNHSIISECWSPIEDLFMRITIDYTRETIFGQTTGISTNLMGFDEVIQCPAQLKIANHSRIIENSAEVYPNPSSGTSNLIVELKHPGKLSYQIMNITGQVLKINGENIDVLAGKTSLPLNTYDLPNGTYFLNVSLDGKPLKTPQKFIVAK